jgi:hypothetical protein
VGCVLMRNEEGGVFRSHDGWGWHCKICYPITRYGIGWGKVSAARLDSHDFAARKWESHRATPLHQCQLTRLRDTQDFVSRVLDLAGIVDR